MPEKAWAYYSSAADDEITNRENHAAYHRIWWRPRILRDVTNVDWSTQILGHRSSMPLYIVSLLCLITLPILIAWSQTATALGKLGHPDGELNLTKAAAKHGVIQMVGFCHWHTMSGLWNSTHKDTHPSVVFFRRNCRCSRSRTSAVFPAVSVCFKSIDLWH